MRRVQIIIDDELEREFDRFKIEDHRSTDADAGRALFIQALAHRRESKPQTKQNPSARR